MTDGRLKRAPGVLLAAGASLISLYALAWLGAWFVVGPGLQGGSASPACTQPESIVYEDGSSYSVFVKGPSLSLSLDPGPPHAVVSRYGDGGYGVFVELDGSTDASDVSCSWEHDRVRILEPAGTAHEVLATGFTGGR